MAAICDASGLHALTMNMVTLPISRLLARKIKAPTILQASGATILPTIFSPLPPFFPHGLGSSSSLILLFPRLDIWVSRAKAPADMSLEYRSLNTNLGYQGSRLLAFLIDLGAPFFPRPRTCFVPFRSICLPTEGEYKEPERDKLQEISRQQQRNVPMLLELFPHDWIAADGTTLIVGFSVKRSSYGSEERRINVYQMSMWTNLAL